MSKYRVTYTDAPGQTTVLASNLSLQEASGKAAQYEAENQVNGWAGSCNIEPQPKK